MIIISIIVFIALFAAANYYVGLHGIKTLKLLLSITNSKIYWTVFAIIAASYIIASVGKNYLPNWIDFGFDMLGSYWLSALMYFLILFGLLDLLQFFIRLVFKTHFGFMSKDVWYLVSNVIIILFVIIFLLYGTWNAKNIKIVKYDVNIEKSSKIEELHAVFISDVHLGTLVREKRLNEMVDKINELNPDIVFFGGDLIDNDIKPFEKYEMGKIINGIKTKKYGVYGILGNHEYFSGDMKEIKNSYEKAGIKLLCDKYEKIDNNFYIIGREDLSSERYYHSKRKNISSIMEDLDKSLPIIVLDHQPSNLTEGKKGGVDFQLSGHTHKGQFFPADLVTKLIFEKDWGYLKEKNYNLIVSSGYGTWGPPIRIGSHSEIVDIKITFSQQK